MVDILHTGDRLLLYYSNWHAGQRYLVVLAKTENGRWAHEGSYNLFKEDGSTLHVGYLMYAEPWLYLGSSFEKDIRRISLEQLVKLSEDSSNVYTSQDRVAR